MENRSLGLLVAAFILLIVGVAGFVTTIASEEQKKTTLLSVENETVSIISLRDQNDGAQVNGTANLTIAENNEGSWKEVEPECYIANFVLRNVSGTTMIVNTDYNIQLSSGRLALTINSTNYNNSAVAGNETYVDYNYCGNDYVTERWARTVLDLVPGFFSLALLLISVGLFYSVMKNEGLIGV